MNKELFKIVDDKQGNVRAMFYPLCSGPDTDGHVFFTVFMSLLNDCKDERKRNVIIAHIITGIALSTNLLDSTDEETKELFANILNDGWDYIDELQKAGEYKKIVKND